MAALTPEELAKLALEQTKLATIQLKEQAKIRAELSNSLDGYIKGIKDLKAIQDTIKYNEEKILKLKNDGITRTDEELAIHEAKLKILEEQTKILRTQGVELKAALKTVNTTNLAMSKIASSAVKGLAQLPGIIQNSFGKLKGYGLFEMDKAIKMSALQMGLLGKEGDEFNKTMIRVAGDTNNIGVTVEKLSALQADFNYNLGRTLMLSDKNLKAMAAMSVATGLSSEDVGQMASDMDEQGKSVSETSKYLEDSMNSSHAMGLNATKVIKNIQSNMKLLNKTNFKDGVKGLEAMGKLATKLGVKMDFAAGMSDKLWDIEGAVDMSAQLQVMGGAWAKLADPFHLMYMARNDMKGLTEEIANASQASMHLGKDGGIEMTSMEMSRLKIVAKEANLEYDDLVKSGKELFKMNKVKQQIGFQVDPETKEFIANTAQLNKKGKAEIDIKGYTKLMSQLTSADVNYLKTKTLEKASLEERAKASQNFDDKVTNFINMVKTYMLPIIDGINDVLSPIVDKFMKGDFKGEIRKIGESIGNSIIAVKPVFDAIGNFINMLGPGKTLGLLFGGKILFDVALWALNGVSLGQAFLATTKSFGNGMPGASSSWTPGQSGNGKGWSMGKRVGAGVGLGVAGMGADYLTDKYTEEGSNANIGGKALSGALSGAAMGAMLGPWGLAGGALIGGLYGGITAAMKEPKNKINGVNNPTIKQPINDGISKSGYSRGILAGGTITPISNKDDLMSFKSKGLIDNALNKNANVPSTMKIEFGEIKFGGELKLTTPGSPGQGIDLLKNQDFIRNMTTLIHSETQKQINGGKNKG